MDIYLHKQMFSEKYHFIAYLFEISTFDKINSYYFPDMSFA